MIDNDIYQTIIKKKALGLKQIAILLDPDKLDKRSLIETIDKVEESNIDFIFVGGSLMVTENFNDCLTEIKIRTKKPVVIFPGSPLQVNKQADAILLLSLISGRNPEFLIGQHVIAAPALKKSRLEIIPTGYILVDSGRQTTASYISNTTPLPHDKGDVAACTALAGEMLGLKLIYLDGGSGALMGVSGKMIKEVRKTINIPIIVGGGIKTAKQAEEACFAGADLIVVGNAFEENNNLIKEISEAVHQTICT